MVLNKLKSLFVSEGSQLKELFHTKYGSEYISHIISLYGSSASSINQYLSKAHCDNAKFILFVEEITGKEYSSVVKTYYNQLRDYIIMKRRLYGIEEYKLIEFESINEILNEHKYKDLLELNKVVYNICLFSKDRMASIEKLKMLLEEIESTNNKALVKANISMFYLMIDRQKEAKEYLIEALDMNFTSKYAKYRIFYIAAHHFKSIKKPRYVKSRSFYNKALENSTSDTQKARCYNGIALICKYTNDIDEAIKNYQLAADHFGKDSQNYVWLRNNLASLYFTYGYLRNAEEIITEVFRSIDRVEQAEKRINIIDTYIMIFGIEHFESLLEHIIKDANNLATNQKKLNECIDTLINKVQVNDKDKLFKIMNSVKELIDKIDDDIMKESLKLNLANATIKYLL